MGKKLTNNEFIIRLKNINKNIDLLAPYVGIYTKILCKCNTCHHEWYATPNNLLKGRDCPICAQKSRIKTKTQDLDEVIAELHIKNPNILIIGEYKNKRIPVKLQCKICGNTWETSISSVLMGHGCQKCYNNRCKKDNTYLIEKLKSKGIVNVIPISNYEKVNKPIKAKCLTCGHEWTTTPNKLYHNIGCPVCAMSKGETKIYNFLIAQNIKFDIQVKFDGLIGTYNKPLSYDFYLYTYNLLIEYQGEFHDGNIKNDYQTPSQLRRQQEHDRRKRNYAQDNNIKLLEIWYWDFDNIESILKKELGTEPSSFFI